MEREAVWIVTPCLPGKFQFLELLFTDLFGAVGTDGSVGSAGAGFGDDDLGVAAFGAEGNEVYEVDLVEEVAGHGG